MSVRHNRFCLHFTNTLSQTFKNGEDIMISEVFQSLHFFSNLNNESYLLEKLINSINILKELSFNCNKIMTENTQIVIFNFLKRSKSLLTLKLNRVLFKENE